MYAKVFTSIFDSTINEQPPHVFKVWIALLAFAQDEDGTVDMTPRSIANRTELPIKQVEQALKVLSSPDPRSRCRDEEGRRIVPIPGRPYGWQIVTFKHYREMHRTQDRTVYMREYMRERRRPGKQEVTPVSSRKRRSTLSTDTESESESKTLLGLSPDEAFESRWAKYPKKDGKRDARRHFFATVRADADAARFDQALDNYIRRIEVEKIAPKYVKNGSTFFSNWEDYVDWSPDDSGSDSRPEGLRGAAI